MASSPWRGAREARGISLRRLEALTGINRGRLSMIERGLPPSPTEAAAILEVLPPQVTPEVTPPPSTSKP
jgi:Helix-turn-helix